MVKPCTASAEVLHVGDEKDRNWKVAKSVDIASRVSAPQHRRKLSSLDCLHQPKRERSAEAVAAAVDGTDHDEDGDDDGVIAGKYCSKW